ncbi:MAG: DUF6194 family protein [Chthoniobacteraceae bacterium]
MDETSITQFIAGTFSGVDVVVGDEGVGAGDTFFFYDPNRQLDPAHRLPFETIVTKDYGDFDAASNLNRTGVFRLNIGIGRDTYRALFPETEAASATGEAAEAAYDFAAFDRLLPHPVYGKMHWVCILNPSVATFEAVRPLLAEAYDRVARKQAKE